MRFEIDQYSPVVLTLAPCPIVDAENPRASDLYAGSYFQSPQNGIGAGCHTEPIGETSTCLTAQHVADHSDRLGQSTGLSTVLRSNRRQRLYEGNARAAGDVEVRDLHAPASIGVFARDQAGERRFRGHRPSAKRWL
jgi:hypothetical protein